MSLFYKSCKTLGAIFLLVAPVLGCGVKGMPQAPAKPVVMSHGYPNFAKVNEDLEAKRKKSAHPIKDDFEDEEDFPEGSSKQ